MIAFGRERLSDWLLDPAVTYLNHGTVGATPRRVLAKQQALRDEMERRPSSFMLREAVSMLGARAHGGGLVRDAAAVVASFVNARPADLGFVTNVTAGINAVLRAQRFAAGDEIVLFDHAYGAIVNAASSIGGAQGAVVTRATLPETLRSPQDAVDALERALTDRTRLAILDHVTSSSALLLPIAELVRVCHARGVRVLVDGAHAPGAVPVDVTAIGADWYAANLHKWAWAPRSCGFLHARANAQAGLHAPIVSWGLDQGLTAELDWQGTFDPTPMLASTEGIAMLRELDIARVQGHNHALAWRAAELLREHVGAALLAPEEMIGTMVTVMLPARFGASKQDAGLLRDRLLDAEHIEVQVHDSGGRVHVRVCAQIYNGERDVDALVSALRST
jgi:isopenicillin-N epimerase